MVEEKRECARTPADCPCSYFVKHGENDEEYPCSIEDISEKGIAVIAETAEGFKAGPKGGVKPGMSIRISVPGVTLNCKVAYVDTGRIGAYFQEITPEQKEVIKNIAA